MRIRSHDLMYAIASMASRAATRKSGSPAGQVGLDQLWKRAKEQSGIYLQSSLLLFLLQQLYSVERVVCTMCMLARP